MTTPNLTLEQLPYGYEAGLLSDLFALPGKIAGAIIAFIDSVGEAIDLRNNYLALSSLSDAALQQRGLSRETIAQFVAYQAGLIAAPVTPAANNGNSSLQVVRPAA